MEAPSAPFPDAFYAPVSEKEPSGRELERHEFVAIEAECQGKPGRWDAVLGRESDPTPPNYRTARRMAQETLAKTRDFRVLARLVEIESHVTGPAGVHAALHLLNHYVANQWEATHPKPSPEGDSERRKALAPLRSRQRICEGLEAAQVFRGAGVDGPVTIRHFLLASGAMRARAGEAFWGAAGLEEVVSKAAAWAAIESAKGDLAAAAEIASHIHDLLAERLERAPDLLPLARSLSDYAAALASYASPGAVAEARADDGLASAAHESNEPARPSAPLSADALQSRAEAADLLDEVIGYYAREARSSPVPLVLIAIRDMAGATFAGWRDALAKNGADEAALDIGGVDASRLDAYLGTDSEGAEAEPALAALRREIASLRSLVDEMMSIRRAAGPLMDLAETAARRLVEVEKTLDLTEASIAAAAKSAPHEKPEPSVKGSVRSRQEVMLALDRLASFHERAEPTSPAPVLLTRVKSLVEASFLDTIRELAPKGGDSSSLKLIPPAKKGA